MPDDPHMSAENAVSLLRLLHSAGVRTWLEGGWGVDALLARQTRTHGDLDLFIERHDVSALRAALSVEGFAEVPGGRPDNFVMKDGLREVDVHVFELDPAGNGLYPMADGTTWVCPAIGLAGHGIILQQEVQCFTADLQLQCYSGYALDDNDLHDIAVLRQAFPDAEPLPLEVRSGDG